MKLIYVVTEGQTETNFVNKILNPYFCGSDKFLIPTTVLTKADEQKGRMYKGGLVDYAKARLTIRNNLAYTNKQNVYVTTMFDLYALPRDTPGMIEADKISDPYEKVAVLEKSMLNFEKELRKPVFHPYIQLHEFEALLFSNLDLLAIEYFEYDIQPLKDCLEKKKNPELINDGRETAPSKRILKCIPDYDKVTSGISVLEKIGLPALCCKCKHFSEWIDWIQEL